METKPLKKKRVKYSEGPKSKAVRFWTPHFVRVVQHQYDRPVKVVVAVQLRGRQQETAFLRLLDGVRPFPALDLDRPLLGAVVRKGRRFCRRTWFGQVLLSYQLCAEGAPVRLQDRSSVLQGEGVNVL
jgi:hypothetical protein